MKLTKILESVFSKKSLGKNSITKFKVLFHTSDETEYIYEGTEESNALGEFNSFNYGDIPERMQDRDGMYITLESYVDTYKYIGDADEYNDYPIEDYYDDDTLYKLIDTSESETLKERSIKPINKDSDELLGDVQNYFQKKYKSKYGKYIKIGVGEHCIQLRISDHTENIKNIDRFDSCNFHISVVIADLDVTKSRFTVQNDFERNKNEYELSYSSDYTYDNIIENIEELVNKCINFLKKNNK
jgi:hypothetical protein